MMQRVLALKELLHALSVLARTSILFRVGGQRAVARATARAMATQPATAAQLRRSGIDPWQLDRAVWRARGVWPRPVLCLQTALTLHLLFRAHGVAAAVRVGVRQDAPDALAAHAWVEVGDLTIDDGRVHRAFSAFPATSAAHGANCT